MERFGVNFGRVVLAVAAAAGVVYVLANSSGHPALIAAAVLFLAATGALINRAWAAALPFGVVVALMLFNGAVSGTPDGNDMTWWGYFVLFAAMAGLVSLCLLVGVGVRRAARGVRREPQRSDFSPQ